MSLQVVSIETIVNLNPELQIKAKHQLKNCLFLYRRLDLQPISLIRPERLAEDCCSGTDELACGARTLRGTFRFIALFSEQYRYSVIGLRPKIRP